MDARPFDKSKLPSRHVRQRPTRAPHRSYRYAVDGAAAPRNLENVKFNQNQKVAFAVSKAISTTDGAVDLKGSRAPEGAIVKVAGMTTLQFSGPARAFDCEEDGFRAVDTRHYTTEILVIRRTDLLTHAGGKAEVVCNADI